jgi:glycerol-3-phosphate dehydrogenase (NAD(P)+)
MTRTNLRKTEAVSAPRRVAVIGAGSWGTTVATLLAPRCSTVLWGRRAEVVEQLATTRTNPAYLPGVLVADELEVTADLHGAVQGAELLVVAVPSHGFRDVLSEAASAATAGVPVLSLAKGLEPGTRRRMTEVILEVLPGSPAGTLTGPNLAGEIAAGQPAASVLAFADEDIARDVQALFHRTSLRTYTNPDVVGCEIAGAVKNVIAIAAGMVEGMGFGENTKATIVTRGLAELTRLGVALGGDARTFAGLAGLGDLVATCGSDRSRNHRVGVALGQGRSVRDALPATSMVAEGIGTSAVTCALAALVGVEMPIAEQVRAVCHDGASAASAVDALLSRPPTRELT